MKKIFGIILSVIGSIIGLILKIKGQGEANGPRNIQISFTSIMLEI